MRKALIVLGLLLTLASAAAAQGNGKSWLHGSWEGTGYQNDSDGNNTWPMTLTIKRGKIGRRTFSIDYPSLSCGGRWKLLGVKVSQARFRELLDHGQDKCSDKGLVLIERKGRQLIFLYSNQGSREITSAAVLNRKRQTSNK